MIRITTIGSIDYYQVKERRIAEDRQDLGLGYYEERGGSLGTLLRLAGPGLSDRDRESGPFKSIQDGDAASFAIVDRLGQGRDLLTGEVLIKPVATGRSRRGRRKADVDTPTHVVAYDLTFAPEKAYSMLALLSGPQQRDRMLAIHDEAVEATLRLMAREGFIINRRGAQGRIRRPAAEACVAVYRHLTNRDKHPHLHSHAVLFNLCLREDGGVGAIENKDLLIFNNACSALYRAELVRRMKDRLGIETELSKDGPGITIPGVPIEAAKLFSQRRADVVADLEAKGLDSAHHREASDYAARRTRDRKDVSTPLTKLQQAWHDELAEAGFDIGSIWANVRTESARLRATDSSAHNANATMQRVRASHDAFNDNNLIVTRADILRIEAQARQTRHTAGEILEHARAKETDFIALPRFAHEQQRFIIPAAIRDEHALLRAANSARGNWTPPPDNLFAEVLSGSAASFEQREAVRHMLNKDGVCIAEGAAGTGKTYVLKLLRDILTADQRKMLIAAPAWKAARLAGQESHVPTADAQALEPLVLKIRQGKLTIDRRTVIVIDEAGMAGCRDIQILTSAVRQAGAKLVLTGDTRQLQPVARGAPMRALIELLGSHRLNRIRRQAAPWMRVASEAFASGDPVAGLTAYDREGAISVHRDRSATLEACVDSYLDAGVWGDPNWTTRDAARRLLITARNEDVHALNEVVRRRLLADGYLGEDAVTIEAVRRGTNKHTDIEIRRGERIMFGRRVRLESSEIFNSDVATVISVDDDGHDPRLTFELDRLDDSGRSIMLSVRASELAVKDNRSGPASVYLQHAYACTNYAAQGQTVDFVTVANLSAMGSSDTYVACTRHRTGLVIHVDASRILPRSRSSVAGISRKGGFRGAGEGGDAGTPSLTAQQTEHIKDELRREANVRPLKANPSDFVENVVAWIQAKDPVVAFREQMKARANSQILHRGQPEAKSARTPQPQKPELSRPVAPAPIDLGKTDPHPLSLSKAEQARLDQLPLAETCRAWFGGRQIGERIFVHNSSGFAFDYRPSYPDWSRRAVMMLRRAKASSEHQLVQAAVLFLSKSVREARDFVRDKADLWKLNPVARAARAMMRAAWRGGAVKTQTRPWTVATPEVEVDQSTGVRTRKSFLANLARQSSRYSMGVDAKQAAAARYLGAQRLTVFAGEAARSTRALEPSAGSAHWALGLPTAHEVGEGSERSPGVKRMQIRLSRSVQERSRRAEVAGTDHLDPLALVLGRQDGLELDMSSPTTQLSSARAKSLGIHATIASSLGLEVEDEALESEGTRRRKRSIRRAAILDALRARKSPSTHISSARASSLRIYSPIASSLGPEVDDEALEPEGIRQRKRSIRRAAILNALRARELAAHSDQRPEQQITESHIEGIPPAAQSTEIGSRPILRSKILASREPLDRSRINPQTVSLQQLNNAPLPKPHDLPSDNSRRQTERSDGPAREDPKERQSGLLTRALSMFKRDRPASSIAEGKEPGPTIGSPPRERLDPADASKAPVQGRKRTFNVPGLDADAITPRQLTSAELFKQSRPLRDDGPARQASGSPQRSIPQRKSLPASKSKSGKDEPGL